MAEQTKVLRSEHTKDMSPEELLFHFFCFLGSWFHVPEECHAKALIQFCYFVLAGHVSDYRMELVDELDELVVLIADRAFNSFLELVLLHPIPSFPV